jgi:glycosyltransferase involved in cell wall biosynthesis
MATGTPVVAVAWGGPKDYLDESCGILIPPVNATAVISGFAAAMQTLIDKPQLCTSLGAAARKKIEENFGWEQKADRVIDIYRCAVAGCPRVDSEKAANTSGSRDTNMH